MHAARTTAAGAMLVVLPAHELQHAIEIARAPQVRHEPDLQRLLHRNGWVSRNGQLAESRAALVVEKRVYEEVASRRSRQH